MKPKLLVTGVALVVLAFVTAMTRRAPETAPAVPSAAAKAVPRDLKAPASPFMVQDHPSLASHRVFEEPIADGVLPYRGANYRAEVSSDGLRFEAGGNRMTLRARRLEQGGASLDLAAGPATQARWAAAAVDRGSGVTEEFIFENHRAEHIVRVERPIGEGALKVNVSVDTDLSGPVRQVKIEDKAWKDTQLENGGLVFTDAGGNPGLAYHGAVAIDAKGRKQAFNPRWENGEIALEVPAFFMKDAAYPVLIDPWLELNFSGTGGGITANGSMSESPALALIGDGSPCVAWSDSSDGDFDIYFRYWNSFAWVPLGSVNVSANSSRSTNPSIGFHNHTNSLFHPYIAWEDNGSGTTNVYAKFWSGTAWSEKAGSANGSGVSRSIGTPCKNAQALFSFGFIDDSVTGRIPVIVYEKEGVGILCDFLVLQSILTDGWYTHPQGPVTLEPSATRPSAANDFFGLITVAWEESNGTEMVIRAARTLASILEGNGNLPYLTDGETVAGGFVTPDLINFVWPGVVGATPDDVSAGIAGGLSIQAALALDPSGNPWVAWQESVAGEREIYVRRSIGGGAWAGVGGSDTGGGVSRTGTGGTSTSSFPAIGIAAQTPAGSQVRPAIVWEEDLNGNSDIFVRRLNNVQSSWDQISDEGSATAIAPEVATNNGGVSRNASFSLRPKAIIAPDGTITAVWRDGANGTFDLFGRRYHDNEPRNLTQSAPASGVLTTLGQGSVTPSADITFTAQIVAESAALAPLRLQLEVKPNTTAFNNIPTHESSEIASLGTATIVFTGLPNVNYHWQARSVDALGRGSPWIPFGTNANGGVDFGINPNVAGGIGGGGGGGSLLGGPNEHKDKCGLAGLEALALLGLAALARRRRKA